MVDKSIVLSKSQQDLHGQGLVNFQWVETYINGEVTCAFPDG